MSAHTASDFSASPVRALAARSPALDRALVSGPDLMDAWDEAERAGNVLTTYGGVPRILTVRTTAGALVLAYCCDEDAYGAAFVLSPISPALLDDLTACRVPVRDVVEVPWMALVWVEWRSGAVQTASLIRPGDLPKIHLPVAGVTLYLRTTEAL